MNSLPRISSAFLVLLAALSPGLSLSFACAQPTRALSEALAKEDLSAVRLTVAATRQALGPKAGGPEVADTFLPIPKSLSRGAPIKDKAMETLLLVNRAWADEPESLRTALVAEALEALGKLVSEQARAGGHPLSFREWGLFLEAAARQSPSNL